MALTGDSKCASHFLPTMAGSTGHPSKQLVMIQDINAGCCTLRLTWGGILLGTSQEHFLLWNGPSKVFAEEISLRVDCARMCLIPCFHILQAREISSYEGTSASGFLWQKELVQRISSTLTTGSSQTPVLWRTKMKEWEASPGTCTGKWIDVGLKDAQSFRTGIPLKDPENTKYLSW